MIESVNLKIDQSVSFSKTIMSSDISLFAGISSDFHPEHTNLEYVKALGFQKQFVHEAILNGIINSVLKNQLPGKNFILVSQQLEYLNPVFEGDTITARVVIKNWLPEKRLVTLHLACNNQYQKEVITGEAVMIAQQINKGNETEN
jgi:3-hydroxybutyryl-CoA dehydratase